MNRVVDTILKLEGRNDFLDRGVLALGMFALALSAGGTILLY